MANNRGRRLQDFRPPCEKPHEVVENRHGKHLTFCNSPEGSGGTADICDKQNCQIMAKDFEVIDNTSPPLVELSCFTRLLREKDTEIKQTEETVRRLKQARTIAFTSVIESKQRTNNLRRELSKQREKCENLKETDFRIRREIEKVKQEISVLKHQTEEKITALYKVLYAKEKSLIDSLARKKDEEKRRQEILRKNERFNRTLVVARRHFVRMRWLKLFQQWKKHKTLQ